LIVKIKPIATTVIGRQILLCCTTGVVAMNRRTFIALVGGALVWSLGGSAIHGANVAPSA